MSHLTITYAPDDQWMGRVTVSAASDAFAGSGEAWMNAEDLAAFADALGRYPLPSEPPRLSGGYMGYETISVTVTPFDAKGHLVVCVRLANDDMRITEDSSLHENATVRFMTAYAALDRFAKTLAVVAKSQSGEATLLD